MLQAGASQIKKEQHEQNADEPSRRNHTVEQRVSFRPHNKQDKNAHYQADDRELDTNWYWLSLSIRTIIETPPPSVPASLGLRQTVGLPHQKRKRAVPATDQHEVPLR